MSEKLFSFWWYLVFISSYAQTGSEAQPPSISIDISGSFLGIKRWGVKFVSHIHPVQKIRMGSR